MAWAEALGAVAGSMEWVKDLCTDDLTIFSIPTKWVLPLAPITVIECPCCAKSYEMKELIKNGKQATVSCMVCGEAMEVFSDRYGNMKAVWRQKSYL